MKAVQLLLEKGADVNAKATDGATAVTLAERKSYTEVAKLLRQKGAK